MQYRQRASPQEGWLWKDILFLLSSKLASAKTAISSKHSKETVSMITANMHSLSRVAGIQA